MEISSWLNNTQNQKQTLLGLNSFSTFLKVCSAYAEWALDDAGLANRNSAYKIWTCRVPYEKLKDVIETILSKE